MALIKKKKKKWPVWFPFHLLCEIDIGSCFSPPQYITNIKNFIKSQHKIVSQKQYIVIYIKYKRLSALTP